MARVQTSAEVALLRRVIFQHSHLTSLKTLYPLAANWRLKIACLVHPRTLCESHIPELGVNPLYDAPSSPSSRPDMHSLTSTSILHHSHDSIPTKLATKHENKMCKYFLHVPPCRSTVPLSPCWKQRYHSLFVQSFLFKGTKKKMGGEHKKEVIRFVSEGICEICRC
jgi:hypothetical protein